MTFTEDTNFSLGVFGSGEPGQEIVGNLTPGDFDDDGDQDLFFGNKVYQNTESGFTEYAVFDVLPESTAFGGEVFFVSGRWINPDNDEDLDIDLSYYFTTVGIAVNWYENTGSGFEPTNYGSNIPDYLRFNAWQDYDNDGDLDVIVNGYPESGYFEFETKLYENIGSGFAENTNVTLPGIFGTISWKDYDNDGDGDILLTGEDYSEFYFPPRYISQLYENTGDTFVEDTNVILATITQGYNNNIRIYSRALHSWIDYDIDGDWDLLFNVNVNDNSNSAVIKLYENIDGSFTEDTNVILPSNIRSYSWADYDNDGDSDILVAVRSDGLNYSTKIYENTGNGFTEDTNYTIPGVEGKVQWLDYDNDGDLDILLDGFGDFSNNNSNSRGIAVYTNTETGFVKDIDFIGIPILNGIDIPISNPFWIDYDNDGDADILGTYFSPEGLIVKAYRNDTNIANTPPTAPTDLTSIIEAQTVNLTWDAATDAQTPSSGLNYNLRVGTTSGASNIAAGEIDSNTSWKLNLQPGTYYWSVQAIDTGLAESEFSLEQSFTIVDSISPTATSFTPTDNQTEVLLNQPLTIAFDQNVAVGIGNIIIKQTTDNEIVETIDIVSDQVQIDGNRVTVSPTNDLEELTEYYIQINPGAIVDTAGNNYSGIVDTTTWNFTTEKNETVESLTDYTLESDRVKLILLGDENINGTGNNQNNVINGNDGNNLIRGLAGNDTLRGADGNDILNGGNNNDRLNGGEGDDTLNGSRGNDILMGVNGDDLLIGRPGNDRLLGGDGNDTLRGGIGRDRFNGSSGDDILTGGASIDYFIFNSNKEFALSDFGVDTITDFEIGKDIILLDETTFLALSSDAGETRSELDVIADFATVNIDEEAAISEAIIVYSTNTGNMYYNSNSSEPGFGSGGLFATFTDAPDIGVEDFIVRR